MRRILMAGSLVAAAALAACGEGEGAGGITRPAYASAHDTSSGASHYTANGRQVRVEWSTAGYDSSGGFAYEFGYLTAQDINATRDEQLLVSYLVSRCGPGGCTSDEGSGMVARGALGGGPNRMTLDFDPSASAGFTVYSGAGAPVHATWRPDGQFSSRTNGTFEYAYPGFRMKGNGSTDNASAAVSGSIAGNAIPVPVLGSMGTNHNVSLIFSH